MDKYPTITNKSGATLIGRAAFMSFDVAGIRWVKVQAHSAETVTASV